MTLRAKIIGKVQGVYFRAFTRDIAKELGIKGTVRNLKDGSVEVIAVGETSQIATLINYLKKGPPGADVVSLEMQEEEKDLDFDDFKIIY